MIEFFHEQQQTEFLEFCRNAGHLQALLGPSASPKTVCVERNSKKIVAFFVWGVARKVWILGTPSVAGFCEFLTLYFSKIELSRQSDGFLCERMFYEKFSKELGVRFDDDDSWQGDGFLSPLLSCLPSDLLVAPTAQALVVNEVKAGDLAHTDPAIRQAAAEARVWSVGNFEHPVVGYWKFEISRPECLLISRDYFLGLATRTFPKTLQIGYYLEQGLATILQQLRTRHPQLCAFIVTEPPERSELGDWGTNIGFQVATEFRYGAFSMYREALSKFQSSKL